VSVRPTSLGDASLMRAILPGGQKNTVRAFAQIAAESGQPDSGFSRNGRFPWVRATLAVASKQKDGQKTGNGPLPFAG